ncbi:MAG: TetR/AcrR family transcriptional regulator [Chlorobi bacterium]|nr:TetR/AcrR family transcriptional regulator [Chlorobiota bacterium]
MQVSKSKENILEVARHVFSRFGFNKTTMSDIAEAARKGRRTIYSYFNSKEDIYQAVIQKEVDILQNRLSGVLNEELTPRKKLEKYLDTRMNTISELANYYNAIKNAYTQNFSMIQRIRKRFDKAEINMLSSILDHGNKSGVFSIENTELTAKTMVLALKGLEIPIYFNDENFQIKSFIHNLKHILFNGLTK